MKESSPEEKIVLLIDRINYALRDAGYYGIAIAGPAVDRDKQLIGVMMSYDPSYVDPYLNDIAAVCHQLAQETTLEDFALAERKISKLLATTIANKQVHFEEVRQHLTLEDEDNLGKELSVLLPPPDLIKMGIIDPDAPLYKPNVRIHHRSMDDEYEPPSHLEHLLKRRGKWPEEEPLTPVYRRTDPSRRNIRVLPWAPSVYELANHLNNVLHEHGYYGIAVVNLADPELFEAAHPVHLEISFDSKYCKYNEEKIWALCEAEIKHLQYQNHPIDITSVEQRGLLLKELEEAPELRESVKKGLKPNEFKHLLAEMAANGSLHKAKQHGHAVRKKPSSQSR